MIDFKQTKLTEEEIYYYIRENAAIFNSILSSYLGIEEYSRKLHRYSTHFCAYRENQLIGMIACYFNDEINKIGFISSVSVLIEYQRQGITTTLLNLVINYGKTNNFNSIKLEVKNWNTSAIRIYKKSGFVDIDQSNNTITMKLNL